MKTVWLTISKITNLRLFQSEFADGHFKFDENGRNFSNRVQKIVGKGEIAHYEQSFQKTYMLQTRKNKGLFEKGLSIYQMRKLWALQNLKHLQMKNKLQIVKIVFSRLKCFMGEKKMVELYTFPSISAMPSKF